MRNQLRVLSLVFTREFYRANAGFFLVVLGVCFGFMRDQEHKALAAFFVSSVMTVLIPIALWVLYMVKVIGFNTAETLRSRNSFLYQLALANPVTSFVVYFQVALAQMGPAIAYGFFLIGMGVRTGTNETIAVIIVALLSVTATVAYSMSASIRRPGIEKKIFVFQRYLNNRFSRTLPQFYIEWLLRNRPGVVYGTKIFSALLLYAISNLYNYDTYDYRLMAMAGLFVWSANLGLVFYYHHFEVTDFAMVRSLPIVMSRRVIVLIVSMLVLSFPELAIMATYWPAEVGLHQYFFIAIFGMTHMLLSYALLYMRSITFDEFTKWLFYQAIGMIFVILFSVPLPLISVLQVIVAVYWLRKYFYNFQLTS